MRPRLARLLRFAADRLDPPPPPAGVTVTYSGTWPGGITAAATQYTRGMGRVPR
jgi:hypothetical protein